MLTSDFGSRKHSETALSACLLGTTIVRLLTNTIKPCAFNRVIARLTVSIVRPRQSAISERVRGNSKQTPVEPMPIPIVPAEFCATWKTNQELGHDAAEPQRLVA